MAAKACSHPEALDSLFRMIARTYSATLLGVDAVEVEIESYDGGGTPKMLIFGPISPPPVMFDGRNIRNMQKVDFWMM